MHWRGIFRILHRDLGYLFFGTTIIYAISGIAINHRNDWNPNYSISHREVQLSTPFSIPLSRDDAKSLLTTNGVEATYQNHYVPAPGQIRIFFQGGNATLDQKKKTMLIETVHRRPILGSMVRLHYNPGRAWTWFSDIYSVALVVIAITGLFLLRGHHGITRRGGILTALGILTPFLLAFLYF